MELEKTLGDPYQTLRLFGWAPSELDFSKEPVPLPLAEVVNSLNEFIQEDEPEESLGRSSHRSRPAWETFLKLNRLVPTILVITDSLPLPFKNDIGSLVYFLKNKQLPPNVMFRQYSKEEKIEPFEIEMGGRKIRVMDQNQIPKFGKKGWYSIVCVILGSSERDLHRFPCPKMTNMFYLRWDDQIQTPPHLPMHNVDDCRFPKGTRHNDCLVWKRIEEAISTSLAKPYEFGHLALSSAKHI